MSPARRSECASASTDLVLVASVGEARFTRYGACTKTGQPRCPQPSRNAASCRALPAAGAQPRGFDTNTCTTSAPTRSP